jgi:hypothetical protein
MGIVGLYIDKCRYEIQEQQFRYGIPAYTGPFPALYKCEENTEMCMKFVEHFI